jgi:hypothetical protein
LTQLSPSLWWYRDTCNVFLRVAGEVGCSPISRPVAVVRAGELVPMASPVDRPPKGISPG